VSAFSDTLGEAKVPVLELAARYMDVGDTMRQRMTGWFQENYGITLTDFVVENVSLPKEVEEILDKRTSMGLVGDMGAFTQFQSAKAIEARRSSPAGATRCSTRAWASRWAA
jgi:membrane protease subunit (stomatin/prohibitin family)